jgi:hypothetical protein
LSQSFVERLRKAREITTPYDPWTTAIRGLRTQICHDGLERISTDVVFEQLGVPPFKRTPDAAKRVRGLMILDGWVPVRARCVTSRGRASRVRGYARMKQSVQQQATEDDTTKP